MIQGEKITKEIILSYEFAHVLIQKENGVMKADVQFTVTDQDGKLIESIVTTYEGEDYNKWWSNFNCGKMLFENLVKEKGIEAEIPKDIEEEFLNKPDRKEGAAEAIKV